MMSLKSKTILVTGAGQGQAVLSLLLSAASFVPRSDDLDYSRKKLQLFSF